MKYQNLIDPELRRIARKVPYNKALIKCANLFQFLSFHATAVPKGIAHKNITLKGYQGLKFKVDVFEPADVKEPLPCLVYAHGGAFSYKGCFGAISVRRDAF
ncbi:MAG: hypothetical protein NC409_07515 [Clostridium sp.]|nr:hypothetical protein [Clostridium sp.]